MDRSTSTDSDESHLGLREFLQEESFRVFIKDCNDTANRPDHVPSFGRAKRKIRFDPEPTSLPGGKPEFSTPDSLLLHAKFGWLCQWISKMAFRVSAPNSRDGTREDAKNDYDKLITKVLNNDPTVFDSSQYREKRVSELLSEFDACSKCLYSIAATPHEAYCELRARYKEIRSLLELDSPLYPRKSYFTALLQIVENGISRYSAQSDLAIKEYLPALPDDNCHYSVLKNALNNFGTWLDLACSQSDKKQTSKKGRQLLEDSNSSLMDVYKIIWSHLDKAEKGEDLVKQLKANETVIKLIEEINNMNPGKRRMINANLINAAKKKRSRMTK